MFAPAVRLNDWVQQMGKTGFRDLSGTPDWRIQRSAIMRFERSLGGDEAALGEAKYKSEDCGDPVLGIRATPS